MLENHAVFLVTVWLHALFIDADTAGALGCAAAGFRFLYPFLRSWTMMAMELSTQPYWFCLKPLQVNLAWKVVTGAALATSLSEMTLVRMLLCYVGAMIVGVPFAVASAVALKARIGDRTVAPGTVGPGQATMMEDSKKK